MPVTIFQMSKAYDEKIAALEALRETPDPSAAIEPLRRALRGRSSYIAAKAASVAAGLELPALVPDMIDTFDRFLENGAKSDPQCWAKNAIIKALRRLNCEDPAVYRRGAAHFQPEPVWGGQQDTAGTLRSLCGFALSEMGGLRRYDVLSVLADLLADPEKAVRADAARALAQCGGEDAGLLLRLKILCGDKEAEVTGQCLLSLLGLGPDAGVELAARLLAGSDADLRAEVAAALGESRHPGAIELLKTAWERETDPELKRALLISIGASLLPEGVDFLLSLVSDAPAHAAAVALAALAPCRFRAEVAARVASAVATRREREVKAAYEREFAIS